MAWTYQALAAAYNAITPAPADHAAAAVAINAPTVTTTGQPFLWSQATFIARTSVTGDWGRIVARSRQTPALPPVTAIDFAILAAINAVEGVGTDVIHPVDPAWAAMQAGFAALLATGDISAATVAAIEALTISVSPAWEPPVTADDIASALAS